jgi:hypothetical protein
MKSQYFLEEREKETLEIVGIVESEFSALTADQLNIKPAGDKWSISECLAHLNLTLNIYIPQMQKVVEEKEKYGIQKENFSYSAIGKLAVKAMQPKADKSIGFKHENFQKVKSCTFAQIDAQVTISQFLGFQRLHHPGD